MTDSTHVPGVSRDVDEMAGRPEAVGSARGALIDSTSAGSSNGGGSLGSKARAVLRARFGEEVYGSWFHLMEFEAFDGRTVRTSLPTKFLQTWIQPDRLNAKPAYAQRAAVGEDARGHWLLLASPDGADGSLAIRQDARLFVTRLDAGAGLERALDPQRRYWLQVTRGSVRAAGRILGAGDAIGLSEESGLLELAASDAAEVLLFDLP